jgi:membrane-associated phospholipid phosphatase
LWQANAAAETVERDLSGGRDVAVYGSSLVILLSGELAKGLHTGQPINESYHPNTLDRYMRNWFHGETDTLTNFIDNHFGGVITPVAALLAIGMIDIDRHEFSRDVPFYLSGLATTNGITLITKAVAKRPRPYNLPGGVPPPHRSEDDPSHQRSFVSGHTSMAFYGAAFFNLRFRRFMRRNWTRDEYDIGRWASPLVSFGWASFVGLSRIHADKHYFTDVLGGAILGIAMAELYYWLAYETEDDPAPDSGKGLRLSVGFTI